MRGHRKSTRLSFWPPSIPKSHHWGMTQGTEWKFCSICFISFICEKTHKIWYKNLRNWLCNWNLMIFDFLTSSQSHQFDLRVKILHAFCSNHHPRHFDMPLDRGAMIYLYTVKPWFTLNKHRIAIHFDCTGTKAFPMCHQGSFHLKFARKYPLLALKLPENQVFF